MSSSLLTAAIPTHIRIRIYLARRSRALRSRLHIWRREASSVGSTLAPHIQSCIAFSRRAEKSRAICAVAGAFTVRARLPSKETEEP